MSVPTRNELQQRLQDYLGRANVEATQTLISALNEFSIAPSRGRYFKMFALAPRWYGEPTVIRTKLADVHPELGTAKWSHDQLARLSILLAAQAVWPTDRFSEELETLFNTADSRELIMLYRSLPLLQHPHHFVDRAREGARSNMVDVFQAIAHDNSYPCQYFDQASWNQLVLKAVFIGCALGPMIGLDERNNPDLAHMLCDYVRERWVAQRPVAWEIWRSIGSHAQKPEDLDILAQALASQSALTRAAAAMALRDRTITGASALHEMHHEAIRQLGDRNWQQLANLYKG